MSQHRIQAAFSVGSFRTRHYSDVSARSNPISVDELSFASSTVLKDEDETETEEHFFERRFGWRLLFYLPVDPVWECFIMVMVILDLFILSLVVNHNYVHEEGKRNLLCELKCLLS